MRVARSTILPLALASALGVAAAQQQAPADNQASGANESYDQQQNIQAMMSMYRPPDPQPITVNPALNGTYTVPPADRPNGMRSDTLAGTRAGTSTGTGTSTSTPTRAATATPTAPTPAPPTPPSPTPTPPTPPPTLPAAPQPPPESPPGLRDGAAAGPVGDSRVPAPLLVLGALLALLAAASLEAGRRIRVRTRIRKMAQTLAVSPRLDRGEGGVTGDEIALAGPEVRLRTRLEPGGIFFDGDEPVIEREERDG